MGLKREVSLFLGITGLILMIFSMQKIQAITGMVIGTNLTSKFLGIFGFVLIITVIIIQKYELRKKNNS